MTTSDPRHAVACQCRLMPGLFHCAETTEPTHRPTTFITVLNYILPHTHSLLIHSFH